MTIAAIRRMTERWILTSKFPSGIPLARPNFSIKQGVLKIVNLRIKKKKAM
jgi:hypothetical protein